MRITLATFEKLEKLVQRDLLVTTCIHHADHLLQRDTQYEYY